MGVGGSEDSRHMSGGIPGGRPAGAGSRIDCGCPRSISGDTPPVIAESGAYPADPEAYTL